MTQQNRGHYAKKHPVDRKIDMEITEALKKHISDGAISCAACHKIAGDLKKSPEEIGVMLDLIEARIIKCQLGLFGYGPEKKVVKPAESIPRTIEKTLRERLADNRISCSSAWQLAEELKVKRMEIASVCEALKIKIRPCQIGAF